MFTERHTRSRPPTSSSLSKRSRTTPSRSSSSSSILRTLVNWFIIVLITNLALSRAVTQSWTWGHEGKWSNPRTIRDLLFPSPPLTLSESQLALHDGSKPSQYPLYIAIDGDVYDVSDGGMRNYGPGGAYSAFAGRDAARAFVTGCFKTHLTHDLRGLSEGDLEIVENWKSFYAKHAKYRYVGRVVHPPIDPSTPIPEPSTLGNNFTSTACPSFFATFLANPRFKTCAPFSLLLTTSTGFFQAERAPYGLLPYVLNASCTASQEECTGLMDSLAAKIQQQNTCGPDLAKGNPLAVEALNGFRSYRLMREAGCQLSNTTGRFCFAEASAKTNPSDLYYYYLPEGTSLPSGATPDCDACTQNLLAVYARYATNTTLAISKTYASGRTAAALACGPNFAPLVATSTAGGKSAASVTVAFDTRITILAAGLGILGPLLLAT
ncbi:sterol metabolism-related protein [Rhodotorula toruloides]|uniref:Sterol metabolism-related protein n=1 Tax=Rhodotorula toruloides TaxID=5286 RepID=A0A511KAE7_RHOTO|nr:sterol metabolism-related protein [Rhodotorula toruloides]